MVLGLSVKDILELLTKAYIAAGGSKCDSSGFENVKKEILSGLQGFNISCPAAATCPALTCPAVPACPSVICPASAGCPTRRLELLALFCCGLCIFVGVVLGRINCCNNRKQKADVYASPTFGALGDPRFRSRQTSAPSSSRASSHGSFGNTGVLGRLAELEFRR
jgi:hypothetical protein